MSFWIKFFKEAGIPAGEAANYAVVFTDNRIQQDMLPDLQKEYLSDMGISVMGDVIAILKHAKLVHTQHARQRALRGSTVIARASPVASPLQKSTPASRTVSHYTRSTTQQPNAEPTGRVSMSTGMAARLGPKTGTPRIAESGGFVKTKISFDRDDSVGMKEEVPVPKKRRVFPEHEGRYKVSMPKGTTMKTKRILAQRGGQAATPYTVFSRLGQTSESQIVKTAGLGKIRISNTPESSVFNRGVTLKRRATIPTQEYAGEEMEVPRPVLKYAGILKPSPKRPKLTITKRVVSDTAVESRLGPEPGSAGIFVGASGKRSVRDRLGGIVLAPATSTTPPVKTIKNIKTNAAPRVTFVGRNNAPAQKMKVTMVNRLGPERNEVTSTTKGFRKTVMGNKTVFSRLGVQPH